MTQLIGILIGFHECQNTIRVNEIIELAVFEYCHFSKYSFRLPALVL